MHVWFVLGKTLGQKMFQWPDCWYTIHFHKVSAHIDPYGLRTPQTYLFMFDLHNLSHTPGPWLKHHAQIVRQRIYMFFYFLCLGSKHKWQLCRTKVLPRILDPHVVRPNCPPKALPKLSAQSVAQIVRQSVAPNPKLSAQSVAQNPKVSAQNPKVSAQSVAQNPK